MTTVAPTKASTKSFKSYLPILQWLPSYDKSWLRPDFIAGLTIMALLVPEGMAYAQLAGVPPQAAFYAAPIGLILFAIFGTSRHLVVAVSAAVSVMSASIIGDLAPAGSEEFVALTAALAIMTGLVAVGAGLLRLGRIAQFFSESVLMGFVSGLALVIMIKQVPKIFGLEPVEGNFWERVIALIRELPETDLLTLAVGLSTLLLMIFIERKYERIPAALVALIYGIGVVSVFNLGAQGVEIVGEIQGGLAPPKIPDVSLDDLLALIPGALALTLVMFSEAIGPDRSFAGKHGEEIDEDQELIGMGMANAGAGLFQGFPIGASLSKSAASDAAGSTTQMAGIIAAIATALVALFFTPLFFNLPEAALGAIVIVAVSGMFKPQEFKRLYRLRKLDFWLATIAFLGVLTFDEVLVGLLIAVAASLLALIGRNSQPQISILGRLPGTVQFHNIETHPEAIQSKGVLIVRPDEGIFFANAASLRKTIRPQLAADDRAVQTVVLDLELSNDLDAPSAEMLEKSYEDLEALDIRLMLTGLHATVQDMLDRSGVTEKIGAENYYSTVLDALLAVAQENIDDLTADEVASIFNEIDTLTEIVSAASERANEGDRATLDAVLEKLGEIQDHPEAQ
jgi:high affinity sulfate transporter 1